jgi:hypothetical protein
MDPMTFRTSARWKRPAIIALVAGTALSCNTDSPVGPSVTQVVGVWTLLMMNGNNLPFDYGGVCGQNGQNLASSNIAVLGSITFYANLQYSISLTYDSKCPGGTVKRNTASADGDWKTDKQQPNSVILVPRTGNGGVVLTGTANPTVPIANGRMNFSASLPSIEGSAQNATAVVVNMTFAR